MSGPSGERCADCYYSAAWSGEDEQPDPYHCYRYPPTETIDDDTIGDGKMPITVTPTMWCGEFRKREAAA
jgi:hypothetical protein